ncbi:ESS family glutamate:Na+ symporter [Kushneria sinocarnis]|uniref:ESS family glutamate:Na+ symporter n=1 Tax=Kushneria sinocarnis TaxID=595502 RepID=A0A420X1L6_9GAMM|nr:sodium/glutamate symporter [Kushneria sinocarnis]RKR07640.1 ESS family glutamate:Na+ symporter [Kushneria sinocarnis]
MTFSLDTLMNDAALMAILLLAGVALRARLVWMQKLFLPASITAGLLGLLLGPNGLDWLGFSGHMASYPGILIAFIFGSLGLAAQRVPLGRIAGRVGSIWSFGNMALIGMYGAGVLFALVFFSPFWSSMPEGFGLLLATGFVGGHGTAAAIGEVFAAHGWPEATSLAMTSATVGVLCSIIGGIAIIRHNSRRGRTSFISEFGSLPSELRTGLVPTDKRESESVETISSMTIEPLLFHLLLVTAVAGASFWLKGTIAALFDFTAPAFALAFLVGLGLNALLSVCGVRHYVSAPVINRIGSGATDVLVAFGIASINLAVVAAYFVPLLLLLFGVAFSYCFFRYVAPCLFREYWFEKGLFGWGWFTGTVAMGIALLRIVDPRLKSRTLDDFALAYIFGAPVEIMLVTFSPILLIAGHSWLYVAITLGTVAVIAAIATRAGWLRLPAADAGEAPARR